MRNLVSTRHGFRRPAANEDWKKDCNLASTACTEISLAAPRRSKSVRPRHSHRNQQLARFRGDHMSNKLARDYLTHREGDVIYDYETM